MNFINVLVINLHCSIKIGLGVTFFSSILYRQ